MLAIRPHLRTSALFRPKNSHARTPSISCAISSRLASTTTTIPKRASARPYIIGVAFIAVGALLGTVVTAVIRPPPFPQAGSDEDAQLLGQLAKDVDNLPLVKKLRRGKAIAAGSVGESLDKETALFDEERRLLNNGEDEEWIELTVSYDRSNTMLNGLLGFGKMGLQRAFWQPITKEVVMIIWYGGALTGWPGIAHGGCTATFCIEGFGKAVNCVRQLGSGSQGDSTTTPDPSSLSLTYLRPINANSIYIMRAQMAEHQLNKKYEVNGTIETVEGKLCVKASAVWDIL
ncbi:hypothetical protein E6O75_ATG08945 [Venturia nashicola]|uniref:Thioesterase domain-containing protein n=1 Tax=Venturia nashicola TaxID=86259 RepID=A0A4Z1NRS4_9PEZI|nr:hypothetical protein E6O75_ATG08945 [Venturia nashicola]